MDDKGYIGKGYLSLSVEFGDFGGDFGRVEDVFWFFVICMP